MKVCLDTHAYSALAKGHPALLDLLETVESIIVPAPVVGELMFWLSERIEGDGE